MRARATKEDPVFAIIAAHRKAALAEDRAKASLDRLRVRLDGRKDQAQLAPSRRLTCARPLMPVGIDPDNPAAMVGGSAGIETFVRRHVEGLARCLGGRTASRVRRLRTDAIDELERAYGRLLRTHDAKRRACGLVDKEFAYRAAEATTADALSALVACRPSTDEGRKALAQYIAAVGFDHAPPWALRKVMSNLA